MKKTRKIRKGTLIFIIVFSIIIVLTLLFVLLGENLLKISYDEKGYNKEIEVNSKDFSYPEVKCTFMGKDNTDVLKRINDIDVTKVGEQTIEYSCSKFMFKKNLKFDYIVVDKEAPVLSLNGDVTISVYVGNEFNEPGVSALDNVDGDLTEKVVVTGVVDTNKEGEYDIKYEVTDSSGNSSTATRSVVVKKKPVSSTCGDAGVIYLTFDDGPNSYYTPVILDVLKKYNVKATFFVTSTGPDELIKREFEEGHAIGLHSSSHAYEKIYASSDAFWKDMNIVRDRVFNITGKRPDLLRFPGGVSNTISRKYSSGIMTRLAKEVEEQGYAYFDWNISSGDAGGTTDPDVEFNNVVKSLSKSRGNVILMHDIKKHTSLAIENIVKYGLEHGYTFDVLNKDIVCHQRINN